MSDGTEIAARHAQVIGEKPRIQPVLADKLGQDAINLVRELRVSAGAAEVPDVPEWMRTLIKHPRLFRHQMETGTTLFYGTIPARERELAVVRVGWLCQAPYEFGQHVNIAKRLGLVSSDIERIIEGPFALGWTDHESAILQGVDELLEDKAISDKTWTFLAQRWDEIQIIEFLAIVGQYTAIAMMQNAIRIRLAPDNPGLFNR